MLFLDIRVSGGVLFHTLFIYRLWYRESYFFGKPPFEKTCGESHQAQTYLVTGSKTSFVPSVM